MSGRIIYIGWVDQGNLGDDLCRDIFIQEFCAAGGAQRAIESVSPQQIKANDFVRNRPDLVVLGGGSLIHPYYLVPLLWAQQYGIPTVVWGSGVDGLPAEILARVQSGESLNGYCLQSHKAELIRHVITNCNQVGLRGPHTLSYLRSLGCSTALEICGDPGLMLRQSETDFCSENLFVGGVPTVGVNWGTTGNKLYGGSEKEVARQLVRVIRELSQNMRVILYAVWPPDLAPLKDLADAVGRSKQIILCETVPSTSFLISLLNGCLFTINFKLHANVFAAALGNPFICLGYRSKCFDFAASLEAEDLVISTAAENLADEVLALSAKIEANFRLYQRRISAIISVYPIRLRRLIKQCVHLL